MESRFDVLLTITGSSGWGRDTELSPGEVPSCPPVPRGEELPYLLPAGPGFKSRPAAESQSIKGRGFVPLSEPGEK